MAFNPNPHGPWRSKERQRTRRSFSWEWVVFGCGVLVILAVLAWSLVVRYTNGRIAPNVSIHGVQVGQMGTTEARILLDQRLRPFHDAPITLVAADQVWSPTAHDLGVMINVDAALSEAYAIGRQPDLLASIREGRTVWRDGRAIALQVTIDEARLQQYLLRVVGAIDLAPVDADIRVEGGQVHIQPEQPGYQVMRDEFAQQIRAAVRTLEPTQIDVPIATLTPAIQEHALAPASARLERLLAQPATIHVGEDRRTIAPAELATLLDLKLVHGASGPEVETTLDLTPFSIWLSELAPSLVRDPVEPRVRFVEGRLQIVVPGQNGQRLDLPQALTVIESALWRGELQITIQLTPVLPDIRPETLADLGIVELVAQGKSDFSGSADYRIQNIQAGAAQMDGVLIPPGATFSFNEQVGAIDESNGFTQGYAIISGRTQLEWGGGVCQVSTTVFRAAFWAGVPIVERNQHSFRIRWYEVYEPIGMDAAIFTGPNGYDLQFVNDTGAHLLMQTEVDLRRSALTIALYGTKLDREVAQTPAEVTNERPPPDEPRYVDDPDLPPGVIKQTDTKRGGMDVRIGRVVRQNGQVVRSDTFVSRYQPWPDIFALGPGATPPTPTPVPIEPPPSTDGALPPSETPVPQTTGG